MPLPAPSRPCLAVLAIPLLALAIAGPAHAAPELTLKRVMLSSAGIGYYEYEAEVDGPATLGLDVPLDQVDDVLKSLVVFDSAGNVGGLSLPGRDGARAAFGDIPFGPEALASPLAYLNALQGVAVTVQGPRPMAGRILHAEAVTETVGPAGAPVVRTVPRVRVSLLTDEGLRQFTLEDADAVQVADTELRARIARALETLRRAAGREMRSLSLAAHGAGRRTVRVGYVAAAPLWKASYRLVLPREQAGKARLQAWAVLENQTGQDWRGVQLTLQYGNPVTFRQALYASYYVQRPEVPVEVMRRILPGVDTRARPAAPPSAPAGGAAERRAASAPSLAMAGRMDAMPAPAAPMDNLAAPAEPAAATEGAEQTTFRLAAPVSLASGHSAAVPILDHELDAERLALAQPQSGAHPLAAIRLANSTGTALPAGVLALYDPAGEAAFAGDARLGGLPAGERRLLAFAQDLRTTLERQQTGQRALVSIAASNGIVRLSHRDRVTIRHALTAPAREPRLVLLEIPRMADRSLTVEGGAPAETEQTATAWRVPVALKPGETRTLVAHLDRTNVEEIALAADDNALLARLIATDGLPGPARAALERIAALRQEAAQRAQDVTRATRDLEAIERNQDRLRRNLASVPERDQLHTRLLRQLEAEENRVGPAQAAIAQAQANAERARKAVADAIAALKL